MVGKIILKTYLIFHFLSEKMLFPSFFDPSVRVAISIVCQQQKYPLSVSCICHINVIMLI